jgi:hypothetical protein
MFFYIALFQIRIIQIRMKCDRTVQEYGGGQAFPSPSLAMSYHYDAYNWVLSKIETL